MSTWSEFPLKARWIASTILQTLSMLLTASLVNRPCSSTLCYVLKPPIWSHCVPIAANLALENVAQKTINSLPNLVIKCAPHHTETVRRITPKCRLSSRHSRLTPVDDSTGRIALFLVGILHEGAQLVGEPLSAKPATRPRTSAATCAGSSNLMHASLTDSVAGWKRLPSVRASSSYLR